MLQFTAVPSASSRAIESLFIIDQKAAVHALGVVRDGVITGEGPTVAGRVH